VVLDLLGNPTLKQVQARGQALLQPNIEDNIYVDLEFEGGQTAHLHCSWLWPEVKRGTTVIADKEMLVYDEVAQKVTVYRKGISSDLTNRDNGAWSPDVATAQPLKLECEHFLHCIETRETPRSDGWNGVAVVEILEQVQTSLNS
jgi:predicted dehydrogenase